MACGSLRWPVEQIVCNVKACEATVCRTSRLLDVHKGSSRGCSWRTWLSKSAAALLIDFVHHADRLHALLGAYLDSQVDQFDRLEVSLKTITQHDADVWNVRSFQRSQHAWGLQMEVEFWQLSRLAARLLQWLHELVHEVLADGLKFALTILR